MKWYDINNISNLNINYNIIFGKRNNGKSYQVKKKVLKEYFEKGNRFIYLRRTVNEIKKDIVSTYFSDFDISEMTGGEYETIIAKGNRFYLANITETNKIILGDCIGYIWCLVHELNYKSGSYLDVTNIIFEEFMTNKLYLSEEPRKLESIYSTVDRNRGIVKLWLIGNSISRVNPYVNGWKIRKVFLSMKPGEIRTVEVITDAELGISREIAIEYCGSDKGGRGNFISSNMNDSGDFEVDIQPLLPGSYKDYKSHFKFVFVYQDFKFLCEYLSKDKDTLFFIRPKYNKIKKNTIVIGDVVDTSIYYQRDIYNFKSRNKQLNQLLYTFSESNLFFSDHRTGTEFKQLIDFTIKK